MPGLVAVVSARPTDGDPHPPASEEKAITSMPAHVTDVTVHVTVGIDTHKDLHVAVALDALGRRLDELVAPTTAAGYRQLHRWASDLGTVQAFGVEGTGSYGAGLARHLRRAGGRVIEVNRPDRSTRHRKGKSDPIDAEAAARAVLSGTATATPKHGDDRVEVIRLIKVTRDSAVKAQTQAVNQLKAVLVTAPEELRESLTGLGLVALLNRCAGLRPGELSTPLAAAKHALRLLARRALTLREEAKHLRTQLASLTTAAAPALVELTGIGPDTAAALLITAGDNPRRLHSEAAFAALCGTNPIPASSGKITRFRLNRGGDRQANAALHRAVVTRIHWHEPTQAYVARRTAEGRTKAEIMRCLKRYLARQVYRALLTSKPVAQVAAPGPEVVPVAA
ncbi:MAG: IS110 family transposase [Actinomycetota bacterium]|nr:IS110 family transposase [Actinomycetota bacterium]